MESGTESETIAAGDCARMKCAAGLVVVVLPAGNDPQSVPIDAIDEAVGLPYSTQQPYGLLRSTDDEINFSFLRRGRINGIA